MGGVSIRRWALACLLPWLLLGAQPARSDGQVPPKPSSIQVVTDDNYPPYVFRDAQGRVDGYLVDLWRLWEKKTGVQVVLTTTSWGEAQEIIQRGQADVIDMIFRTPSREPLYDFSPPYADLPVAIYSHTSIAGITTPDTLRGFQVGVQKGDACIEKLQAEGISTLTPYQNYAELIAAAKAEEIKVFCLDEYPANFYLYKLQAQNEFHKAFELYRGQFHRAVRKGHLETLGLVELGMATITPEEGEALRRKWLGAPLDLTPYGRYFGWISLALVLVGVLLFIWNQTLSRKVAAKTRELNRTLDQLQSAHRQAEDVREHLAATLEAIPDLLFEFDRDGRYLRIYTRDDDMLAQPKETLLGKRVDQVLDRESAQTVQEAIATAASQGSDYGRMIHFPVAGGIRWFELSVTRKKEGEDKPPHFLLLSRDVTQRMEAEAALVAAREEVLLAAQDKRFRELFEAAPIPLAYLTDTGMEIVNHRFTRLLGYSQKDICTPDQWWPQAFPDLRYREKIQTAWQEAIRRARSDDGKVEAIECQVSCKNGTPLTMRIGGQLLESGLLATFTDITEQRRLENQLRQSEERLTLAMEASRDGLWDWNLETGESYCSPAYFRMLGYDDAPFDATMASQWTGLIHPDEQQRTLAEALRRLEDDGHYELEFRMQTKDYGYKWIRSRGKVVARNARGEPVRAVGTHMDLTERKRFEQKLEERERFLASITDGIPGMVGYWNTELRSGYANAAYLEWFGKTKEEMAGVAIQELLGPVQFARNEARIQAALAGQPQNFEQTITSPEGVIRHAWTHYIPDLVDGTVRGFFVLVSDITELKNAQVQLEALNAALNERTTQAEAASVAKSDFLANMSHEIRTPMNAILGLCHLLEKQPLAPAPRDMVRKIHGAGKSLLGIINDILDFSKIEAQRLEIEAINFRLGDVLDNLASITSAAVGSKPVEVVIGAVPAGAEFLEGDPLRLGQVLVNLAGNAIKFTAAGEVVVTTELLATNPEANRVKLRFTVRDTGMGIPESKQAAIFEAFTQADTSTTRSFGGTGLGLAISRSLVELMGGRLQVNSAPGRGSEFSFEISLGLGAPQQNSLPEMLHQNVLVADDHPCALKVLVETLASLGWRAEGVDSGEKAVALAGQAGPRPYDIVLLDWRMPGLDGLDAAIQIRHQQQHKQSPIILMVTAHDRESFNGQPGSHQVDGILTKPVTSSSIYNAVLEAKSRRGQLQYPQAPPPHLRRLAGLRLLVVDDSDINRDVAQRILREEGAEVALAEDGSQALETLTRTPEAFDLVLMDVQMPVMDGYMATRRIRATPSLAHLPVIALTAGAFSTQRSAALEAGMNDFVSKPFNVEQLVTLVRQLTHCPPLASQGDSGGRQEAAAPPPAAPVDLAKGLALWQDPEIYQCYLRRFVSEYGGSLEHLDLAPAPAAAAAIHKMKGAAATLGLVRVPVLAGETERLLKEEQDARASFARLQAAMAEAVAFILSHFPEEEAQAEAGENGTNDAKQGGENS